MLTPAKQSYPRELGFIPISDMKDKSAPQIFLR